MALRALEPAAGGRWPAAYTMPHPPAPNAIHISLDITTWTHPPLCNVVLER